MPDPAVYIGDGITATVDNYGALNLRCEGKTILMDPEVFDSLVRFAIANGVYAP